MRTKRLSKESRKKGDNIYRLSQKKRLTNKDSCDSRDHCTIEEEIMEASKDLGLEPLFSDNETLRVIFLGLKK